MILSVVGMPQTIPLSQAFTNHGWPRNGYIVGTAPVFRIICILKAPKENGKH